MNFLNFISLKFSRTLDGLELASFAYSKSLISTLQKCKNGSRRFSSTVSTSCIALFRKTVSPYSAVQHSLPQSGRMYLPITAVSREAALFRTSIVSKDKSVLLKLNHPQLSSLNSKNAVVGDDNTDVSGTDKRLRMRMRTVSSSPAVCFDAADFDKHHCRSPSTTTTIGGQLLTVTGSTLPTTAVSTPCEFVK